MEELERKKEFSKTANAHPPGLGLSCPQPVPDHPARWVRFLGVPYHAESTLSSAQVLKLPGPGWLGVRLPTALQVLQTLSHNTRRQTGAHWLKEINQTTQVS